MLSEGTGLSDEERHLLAIIQRNSLRIEETVRSVLTLSRKRQSLPQRVDLGEWSLAFAAEFRERHRLNDADLTVSVASAPLVIRADPDHLHQIIANLCDNALVHGRGPNGELNIRIQLGRLHLPERIYLEVCDSGPGISPELVQSIFEPFFTTQRQGVGLGLYIARELAIANGIQLSHLTQPQGACFCLTFGQDLILS